MKAQDTTNSVHAWEMLKALLKKIGWYDTMNYQPFSGSEFVEQYGGPLDENEKTWIASHVLQIQRQCDSYGVKFVWE